MRLEDIAASIAADPEREAKYAREMCRNLKGRVRKNLSTLVTLGIVLLILASRLFHYCAVSPGVFSMLVAILGLMGGVLVMWYLITWELTFDGETGFLSYHTLLQGTVSFHVSEIENFRTTSAYHRSTRSRYFIEKLYIEAGETRIHITLNKRHTDKLSFGMNMGDTDSDKLLQYLELYQKCIATPAEGLAMSGIDPRIAAAIAKEKAAEVVVTDEKTEPVLPENVSEETRAAASVPEENASAEEKKQVDVDALFNNVLRQYGKDTPSGSSSSSGSTGQKDAADVDALFDNVLRQFGKK